jgi:KUP system potassium uptake protein
MATEDVEGELDLERASYFLSRITIVATDAPGMARWRKKLFVVIARNAANPVALFGLPDDQTVILSAHIEL